MLKADYPRQASLIATLPNLIALIAFAIFFDLNTLSSETQVLLLFFGLAPILNSIFDTLSYAATIALGARGHRSYPLLWGLLDAVVAVVLFIGLGAAFVIGISLLERLSSADLLDLGTILEQAGDFITYWWLYAMLFSTALPTLLHIGIASLSLRSLMFPELQGWLAQQIRAAQEGNETASVIAPIALGAIWTLCLCIGFGALALFVWLASGGIAHALGLYRDILLHIAIWIRGV